MFVFNNISSDDMEVILEEDDSLIGKASQKYSKIDIDGSNDSYFEELGYSTINKTIKLYVLNPKKINLILAWLNGSGILEFNNRITKARFYSEANPQRSASIKILETELIRDPFWTLKEDDYIMVKDLIVNNGTIYSEPIVKLKRKNEDKVDISINDIRFLYTFKNEDNVEIDFQTGNVIYDGLNRNKQIEIGYKFPKLKVGENRIIMNSGDCDIYVKRKDRWL